MRDLLQKHPMATTIATVAVLAGALLYMVASSRPASKGAEQAYYYDLGTGNLFPHAITAPFEVLAPSGKQGVRAYVFSCGQCEPDAWRVAYLKKRSPDAVEAIAAATAQPDNEALQARAADLGDSGTFIAAYPSSSNDVAWMPASAPEAAQLMQQAMTMCDNDRQPQPCLPSSGQR